MGWWGLGLALLLPWLTATLWLRLLWPAPASAPRSGRWPLLLGYGYVLGLIAVSLLMRAQDALGLRLDGIRPLLVLAVAAVVGARWLRQQDATAPQPRAGQTETWSLWTRLGAALVLLWVALRLLDLALESWWQPLLPWDAWTTWSLRARAWAELRVLVPFVAPHQWLAEPESGAYSIAAAHYPKTVSLIGAWAALAYGGWHEGAANLPWIGCALALALGFYGQARLWGASPLAAAIALWMLFSLPLLDTHIALGGYADLWLATLVGLAVMALLQWARTGEASQGVLALLCALTLPLIKLEGMVWMLLLAPVALSARLRPLWLLGLLGLSAAGALALLLSGGFRVELPGLGVVAISPTLIELPWLGVFQLGFHNSLGAVTRNLFLYESWHLFGYLLLVALGWALIDVRHGLSQSWTRAGLVLVLASLGALFVLFFLTDAHLWATKSTSINRILLHFTPAFGFWMLVLWLDLQSRRYAGLSASAGRARPSSGRAADE